MRCSFFLSLQSYAEWCQRISSISLCLRPHLTTTPKHLYFCWFLSYTCWVQRGNANLCSPPLLSVAQQSGPNCALCRCLTAVRVHGSVCTCLTFEVAKVSLWVYLLSSYENISLVVCTLQPSAINTLFPFCRIQQILFYFAKFHNSHNQWIIFFFPVSSLALSHKIINSICPLRQHLSNKNIMNYVLCE